MLLDEFLSVSPLLRYSWSGISGMGPLIILSEATEVIVEDIDRDL